MTQTVNWIRQSPARGMRMGIGMTVLLAGMLAVGQELWMAAGSAVLSALSSAASLNTLKISVVAGAATGLGALTLLVVRRIDEEGLGLFMAVSAGMMAAAALFSLFLPAVSAEGMALTAVGATVAGFVLMRVLDSALPHEHPLEHEAQGTLRTALLMTVAIALHNIPEGFAVGASPATSAVGTGLSIGLQNIPEGMIVATALWFAGVDKLTAALLALATGLIEPVGAVMGLAAAQSWDSGPSFAMGVAAGAMAFVVAHEIWPEAKKRARPGQAEIGLGISAAAASALLALVS